MTQAFEGEITSLTRPGPFRKAIQVQFTLDGRQIPQDGLL